ncbi:MAG: L-threonylcarbamoyladenylate synthase [Spirochaetales bacterium]|jgi:L-threonylcarbamoyladenylate synthase|nr:L-threonylcarbamoyladenylate synthase [Spirochaetales bacterium]
MSQGISAKKPAVFLDRDGTIIEDVGILDDERHMVLISDSVDALRELAKTYLLFVITNQGGVAQGKLTLGQVDNINRALHKRLSDEGIHVSKWYVCPHMREDNCSCIKPSSHFLLEAENEFGIDLSRSFTIGDHPHDTAMGKEHGVFGLYLLTGHGAKHLADVENETLIFHSLKDAAGWIKNHPEAAISLEKEISDGVDAIRRGGLTVFPTETVYGLGADAMQENAVRKIFAAKNRPSQDPLISHVASREQAQLLVQELPKKAEKLMDAFWPGPLTLVLKKASSVPNIVTAGNPTVAVRMPNHPIALELIRRCRTPVAAPSANTFGKTSPTTAQHVIDQLSGKFEAIIDGGACRVGVESTVLSLVEDPPLLLRPGGITIEDIEKVIGPIAVQLPQGNVIFDSPGMFPSHYAPKTPMIVVDEPGLYAHETNVAVMLFRPAKTAYSGDVFILSEEGDARGAAAKLYQTMRKIDQKNYRLIIAEKLPHEGMGIAVNDRMSRASKK